ncbi:hypothetical protein GF378_01230 [Candidatus Pacearchaeota archaeon]|nr:hypothetical protein [Candidatus Pacearchaeota archaeon]
MVNKTLERLVVYPLLFILMGLAPINCGMADYGQKEDEVPVEEYETAEEYVLSELEGRGYTDITHDYFTLLQNFDSGDMVSNIYDFRAYNPTTGDEQLWEIEFIASKVISLRDSRIGTPPDICLVEGEDYSQANLDSMIDEYCNN